jgi:hypothetical protein
LSKLPIAGAPVNAAVSRYKKADAVGHPEVSDRVGLLVNEPPGTAELFFV